MNDQAVISVHGLRKTFGKIEAVRGILGVANRTSPFVMAARDAGVELLPEHHP